MSSTPIWIYDRDEQLQLILNPNSDIPHYDSWFTEQINGAISLEFSVPASLPEVSAIENDGRAVIRDKDGDFVEFIIRQILDSNGDDGPVKEVFAEGGDYELIDEWMTGYTSANVTLETALSAVLSTSRWSIGRVDDFETHSVNIKPTTVKNAVLQLLTIFGGEIRYRVTHSGNRIDRRYIDVLHRRGNDNGKRFEYGKDIQEISYLPDSSQIKTALYGYGASGENDGPRVTFEDIEWSKSAGDPVDKPEGQQWVGDPEALSKWGYSQGTRHKFGEYSGQEEDAATLLLNTWRQLQQIKDSIRTYEMKVSLLEGTPGYEHEAVRLGDTVSGIDRTIYPHIETTSNIIEYRQNLNDVNLDEVVVGQFRNTLDIATSVLSIESVVEEKQGNWDNKETPEGAQDKADKVLEEAQDRIDEAQDRIDEANIEIDAAKVRIDEAKQELAEAEGRIGEAEQSIGTLRTDLSTASGRISNALGDIGDLETDLLLGNFRITENSILTGTIGASNATFLNMTTRYMNAIDATIQDATITGRIGANNATFLYADMEDMTALRATMRNSTITGTLTANNATILKGTFEEAVIVDAKIEDATITGSLVGVGGTFTGTLTAVDGTFTGRLTAATGTFAGSLSAATGTFAGTLQAASGTFGTITSGTINTLTIGSTSGSAIYFGSSNGIINYFDNAMRFQRDVATYYRVNSNSTDPRFQHQFYTGGAVAMNIGNSGSHKSLTAGNAMLKFSSSNNEIQVRNVADNSFGVISASNIEVGSSRDFKKNIEDYVGNASELVKSTPVRVYHLNEDVDGVDPKRVGLIVEESPVEILGNLNGKTLSVDSKANVLWKSVQEILQRLDELERV